MPERVVKETLDKTSITVKEFVGTELVAWKTRLWEARVKLDGPTSFGWRLLRVSTALAS